MVKLGLKEETFVQALWGLLQDEDWYVRVAAINGMVRLGLKDEAFVQALLALLQDENWYVRAAAIGGLEELGLKDEALVQALLGLLQHGDWYIRTTARNALIRLAPSEQTWFNCLVSWNKEAWRIFERDPSELPAPLHSLLRLWIEHQSREALEFIVVKMQDYLAYWREGSLYYYEQGLKQFPLTQEQYLVLGQAFLDELKKPSLIQGPQKGDVDSLEALLNQSVDVTIKDDSLSLEAEYQTVHKRKRTEETHSTTSSEPAFPSTYTTLSKQIGVSKQEEVAKEFPEMDFELQEPQSAHAKELNEEQAQIPCNDAEFEVEREKSNTAFISEELADVPSHVEDNEETFSDDEMEEDEETDESMPHPKT